ncbi:YHYH protein [Actinospongicola halichondriae]|uniref:YHYH protein n=1 Tax=Actinospongicola halichondriae TaxID=3236844 RepID=UPI003D429F4A
MKSTRSPRVRSALASTFVALALLAAACGSDDAESAADTSTTSSSVDDSSTDDTTGDTVAAGSSCGETAALFVTSGSANADLADPEVSATCEGDDVVITSNGIPDYTYIETSPGSPAAGDYTFTIPATPTMADEVTDVPALGTAAVALNGVPIYGPTEGTGGDVLSLVGALSECGSHNGPTGFHIHQILTSENTDCLITPADAAAAPQLVGYALDGYPIYTGIDQYTSSWELTDESLFATDTWAAHTYVEGLGDLDQCNGRTDDDGNYAYYTTATFPYVLGCYSGVVDVTAAGGGGGGGRP